MTDAREPMGSNIPAPEMLVRDEAQLFRADRDQYITEYHTHHAAPLASGGLLGGSGPESVRVALTAPLASPVRDRRELRKTLLSAAFGEGPGSESLHVVHGMPGCGKTAVVQVVFDEVVTRPGFVGLWVNASTATSFRAGMIAVARDRGASQEEVDWAHLGRLPAADLVWRYLDQSAERWLLVLDNADDPTILQEPGWLRPSRQGTVLVTTRNGGAPLWRQAVPHRLDVLAVSDAVDVLLDLDVGDGDVAALEQLARQLGCHPLALMLAGSYLGDQILEPVSVAEYLRRLRQDPGALLDLGAEPGEQDLRRLVSSTWHLSLDSLARKGLPEATAMLRLLSCFAPDPLPVGVLSPSRLDAAGAAQAQSPLPGARANAVLKGLVSHSLVALLEVPGDAGLPAVRSLQAHGLLLDTVAARIPVDQRDAVLHLAARLLGALLGIEAGQAVDAQTLRLFAPHAAALLRRCVSGHSPAVEVALAIVRRLRAQTYLHGDYHAAHSLSADAAAATAGRQTGDALEDQHELGRALSAIGHFTRAAELHRATLHRRETLLGGEHPQTLDSVHALGIALYGLGRWAEDEQQMHRATQGRERALGPAHQDTLESRACLAEAIGEQQRWAEAEALARSNLAASEKAFGAEHPHTLDSRLTLAWVLSGAGQWAEAEVLAQAAILGNAAEFGQDHPRTLAARHRLAAILPHRGQWPQAEEAARSVLAARERLLGHQHAHTLAIRVELARILLGAGQVDAARTLAGETLTDCVSVLGPDHPDTVLCRNIDTETWHSNTQPEIKHPNTDGESEA